MWNKKGPISRALVDIFKNCNRLINCGKKYFISKNIIAVGIKNRRSEFINVSNSFFHFISFGYFKRKDDSGILMFNTQLLTSVFLLERFEQDFRMDKRIV